MKRVVCAKHLLSLLVIVSLVGPAVKADEPTTKPMMNPAEPADIAAPKTSNKKDAKRFQDMHEQFLKRGKEGKIGVLFLGDSITEGWSGRGKDVWTKTYASMDPANFGIGGDRTQHVLWRIDNGELDGISPKVVVLMIGTNNVGSNSSDDIIKADTKIVDEIHQKLPETKILLLAVFPRDMAPDSFRRQEIVKINKGIEKLDDGKKTRFLDIGEKFLTPAGVLTRDIMPDFLHPNAKGYQIWADAMAPLLDEMMK